MTIWEICFLAEEELNIKLNNLLFCLMGSKTDYLLAGTSCQTTSKDFRCVHINMENSVSSHCICVVALRQCLQYTENLQ